MKVQLTTILLICFEHVTKAIAQGMPISPCPKIFQYRFDGNEWFGLIAVRNPDVNQALHLRVTLSMRGKPTTNYLGEIELLTRGQFTHLAPVLYKIRFPKHHFPPKLILISANNHVICFGSGEHSIFMTQIQLEHIRKVTFIADKKITAGGGEEFDLESMPGIGENHFIHQGRFVARAIAVWTFDYRSVTSSNPKVDPAPLIHRYLRHQFLLLSTTTMRLSTL
ncbi:serine protease gd isoform X1 [Drosophila tropicalis]|uniref:serine protease gd isoform X1 n=1 Tax=Drosophila tropicalis TaxID=46794 RepID=UPI0035AC24EE